MIEFRVCVAHGNAFGEFPVWATNKDEAREAFALLFPNADHHVIYVAEVEK